VLSKGLLTVRRNRLQQKLASGSELIRGSLAQTYLTCGTPGCRCHQGEKHGPYYILSWSESGKRKSAYVPEDKVSGVRRMVTNYQAAREALQELGDVNRQLLLGQYQSARSKGGRSGARP